MSLTAGILIDTLFGPKPVEVLRPGEPVLTGQGGIEALGSVAVAKISAAAMARSKAKPIMIRRGAFGRGKPARDMLVSPGQILLIEGRSQTAASLIDGRRVMAVHPRRAISFVELRFDAPGLVLANGTPVIAKALQDARPRLAPAPRLAALPFAPTKTAPLPIPGIRR